MNRALLVSALFGEALLLTLEAHRLPYPSGVRAAAVLLSCAGLVTAVWPLVAQRVSRQEHLSLESLSADLVYLGRGHRWGLPEAQLLLKESELIPGTEAIRLPLHALNQHILVLGTTGAGKTRMLELLIAQAILRGEAVVVIDPKGDHRLYQCIVSACRVSGRDDDLRMLSLPHPGRSVRYNPVGQFSDVREVADRVAALMPSSGHSEPFKNYAWDVVHTIAGALVAMEEPVRLASLRRFAIEDPWELVRRFVERHSEGSLNGPDGMRLAKTYEKKVREGKLEAHRDLDALISLARRPREHYQKMTGSLVPILTKLTSNSVLEKDGLTWEAVSEGPLVVYFDLGMLLGAESAGAVARMATLDVTSHVGRRYAYAKKSEPLSLFVDEAASVATPEFISLLNQGRGAGIRTCLVAQTLSDFEAALGSSSRAEQIFGNVNTIIQFKAQSAHDASAFSDLAGRRLLSLQSEAERYEPALFGSGFRGVDDFRASFGSQTSWNDLPVIPPWAVQELPRFSFFARTPEGLHLGRAPLLKLEHETDSAGNDRCHGGDRGGVVEESDTRATRPVGV